MNEVNDEKRIREFVERFSELRLLSTGAEMMNVSFPLFNVIGSTGDPIPFGTSSWKNLLIEEADLSGASCYVTNETPSGTSHPGFNVGGHMTQNADGSVTDGTCYLMPLCYYHNAQNGDEFEHTETKMLQLTGYMEGEPFATFSLRLPSPEPFALIYFDEADGQWKHRNITSEQVEDIDSRVFGRRKKAKQCSRRILFERAVDSPLVQSVVESNLRSPKKK